MPKVVITEQLANVLKAIRRDNNIAAKDLAGYIQKSQSYVSKLEKGTIKTVSKDELDKIISFITLDKNDFSDKIDEILRTAIYRFTDEEMEEQVWFSNYSTVYCKIPIPEKLVEDICTKMQQYNITIEYLSERINSNEFIADYRTSPRNYPRNEWFIREETSKLEIIMDLSAEKIEEILTFQVKKSRYVYLQAIVLYLFKIIKFGDQITITDGDLRELDSAYKKYLAEFNFYSFSERSKRMAEAAVDNTKVDLLSVQDQSNLELIKKLNALVQIMSEVDVQKANENLSRFLANLEWDEGFILYLVSLNFSDLKDVSYSFKQELLKNIKLLLDQALSSNSSIKKIEQYQ